MARILCTLLNSAGLKAYPKDKRDDPILSSPPPVFELPANLKSIVEQFMLKTEDIEEASYDGNIKVITAFLKQLGLDSDIDRRRAVGLHRWRPAHLRAPHGIGAYSPDNINGFERFDWVFPVFGWLHLAMAFSNPSSLSTRARRPDVVFVLTAFDLITRKGLNKVKTKSPFWFFFDEALHHVVESIILALWIEVAGLPADTKDLSAYLQIRKIYPRFRRRPRKSFGCLRRTSTITTSFAVLGRNICMGRRMLAMRSAPVNSCSSSM